MAQLSLSLCLLTVNVIDLEEELDLVIWTLPGELVHGVKELLERDGTVVVLVKDVEHSLNEEGLQNRMENKVELYGTLMVNMIVNKVELYGTTLMVNGIENKVELYSPFNITVMENKVVL